MALPQLTVKGKSAQKGVALAIVVWFIAGMSLLVAGTVAISRADLRMAQMHVAKAKVAAAGDGAIQLALANIASDGKAGLAGKIYEIGELSVAVTLVSSSLLINMNEAPVEVLSPLFRLAGGAGDSEANQLAHAVVDWRKPGSLERGRATDGQFYSIEDLLRVDGMTRTYLDRIRDFIVAGTWARGGADWRNLPEDVKGAIATGSPVEIGAAIARMDQGQSSATKGRIPGPKTSGTYRADAVVKYGNVSWLRRRWVSMSFTEASGLPWKSVRTEAPRVYIGG